MTGTAQDRQELSEILESDLDAFCDAKATYEASRATLQQFDQDFPELMAALHKAQGEKKIEALGSTGTSVSAEGDAALAPAKGEGG